MHGSHITLSATPRAHDATFAAARAAAFAPRPVSTPLPARGRHNGSHDRDIDPICSAFDAARAANLGSHARTSPTVAFLDGVAVLHGDLVYPPHSREDQFALPYPVPQAVRHLTLNWLMKKGDRWLNRSSRQRYWKAHDDIRAARSGANNSM